MPPHTTVVNKHSPSVVLLKTSACFPGMFCARANAIAPRSPPHHMTHCILPLIFVPGSRPRLSSRLSGKMLSARPTKQPISPKTTNHQLE